MAYYGEDAATEEFELVTVKQHPMLFTNFRINRDTIPRGCFAYEVRHDDECRGEPVEISRRIIVNHWGTLISNVPLPLVRSEPGGRAFLSIDDEDWNHEGITLSLQDYMRDCPPMKTRR